MSTHSFRPEEPEPEGGEFAAAKRSFALNRREFFEMAGAGLLIVTAAPLSEAQRGGGAGTLETRLHVGEDGFITILSGKIEEGQGALTELAMAAAEELRAPLERIHMVMGDTDQTPNDGVTAGSGTTPRTVPQVRRAAAAARGLLLAAAGRQFGVDAARLEVRDGAVQYAGKTYGYADLARSPELAAAYKNVLPEGTAVTAAKDWQILGKPAGPAGHPRPGDRRAPVPQRHRAAGHALRPRAAAALLRRHAWQRGPVGGAEDAGSEGGARRRLRRMRRAHHVRRPQSAGGDLRHGPMEDRRAALERQPVRILEAACQPAGAAPGARQRLGGERPGGSAAPAESHVSGRLRAARPHGAARRRGGVAGGPPHGLDRHQQSRQRPPVAGGGFRRGGRAGARHACLTSAAASAANTPEKRPWKPPAWPRRPAAR